MTTYLTNSNWRGCEFVQVQAYRQMPDGSWTKKSRWKWIKVDEVIKFHDRKRGILTFSTIGHFEQKDKMSKQISNFCGDFDCHNDDEFVLARNSCLEIINYFGDFGLNHEHIRFWFTGGRGYHFEIPHQVFDIEPQVELNLVIKHLASNINAHLHSLNEDSNIDNHLELDLNLYKNPNQFRLPNSFRPDRGTYKVELTWQELRELDKQQLMTLATNLRPPLHDIGTLTFEPVEDAVNWYQDKLTQYQSLQTEIQLASSVTPVNQKAIKQLAYNQTPVANQFKQVTNIPAGIPVCIADLRQNGIKQTGDRNMATMLDSCYCREAGIPLADAKTIIDTWVQAIPVNMTSKAPGPERQKETYSTVDYIYQNTKYQFACGYAIGRGLTCNRDRCPLWQQQAFQKWSKNVKTLPNFTAQSQPTQSHSIDDVRQMCSDKVKKYIASDDTSSLFLLLKQGGGKSFTSLTSVRELNNIRVLYAAPRHEIITSLEEEGLINRHIHRRNETNCMNSQLAAYYARRRYNVVQKLCRHNCEVGMDNCLYHKQFTQIFTGEVAGIVHEVLFIPAYMEKLLENTSCDDIPTVVIFDEPDPQKFFDTVNITNKQITEFINTCKNSETKTLLTYIRSVIEKLRQEEKYTGKQAMERILAEIPADTTFEKLLTETNDYASIQDSYKAVKFDYKVDYSEKSSSYLLQFNDEQIWIPDDDCYIIDSDNIIMVKPYIIDAKNLTPLPDDDKLPLNFLKDLTKELSTEYEKYKEGCEYNSIISIGRLPGSKAPVIRLKLPKTFAVPEDTKLIMLDGSGIPELLEVLTKRETKTWTAPLQSDVETVQITDGSYGITTLTNPNSSACKNLTKLANQIADEAPGDTVVFTWKAIEDVIHYQQTNSQFNPKVEVDHYGNLEGKNDYEHKQTVILLGTPTPKSQDMIELANAIWRDDELLDTESIKNDNWRPYQYVDSQQNGYAVEVREFKDNRLNIILNTHREQELIQAAHRIRPVLYPGKSIYLLTNLPLDSLPPAKLTTVKELGIDTSTEFKLFCELIQEIVKICSGIWRELIIKLSCQMNKDRNVISNIPLLHSCLYSLPTGGTLKLWFNKAVSNLGYISNNLNLPNTGPGRPLKIYHDGNLDTAKIEALYQQINCELILL